MPTKKQLKKQRHKAHNHEVIFATLTKQIQDFFTYLAGLTRKAGL